MPLGSSQHIQYWIFVPFLQELGKNWKTFENEDAAARDIDRVDDGGSDNRLVVSVCRPARFHCSTDNPSSNSYL